MVDLLAGSCTLIEHHMTLHQPVPWLGEDLSLCIRIVFTNTGVFLCCLPTETHFCVWQDHSATPV